MKTKIRTIDSFVSSSDNKEIIEILLEYRAKLEKKRDDTADFLDGGYIK